MKHKQNSFYQLFVDQLQDIYNAENQSLRVIPKMIDAAALPELKDAFQKHLKDTQKQIHRLKKIFTHLGISLNGKVCKGMEGIIRENDEIIGKFPLSALRDAALICLAQKMEHYEIAGYGTARTYADHLELDQVADLLKDSLDEEGATDRKLTRLAEGTFFNRGINEEAKKEETGLKAQDLRHINKALQKEDFEGTKKRKPTTRKKVVAKASAKTGTKRKATAKVVHKTRSNVGHTGSHAPSRASISARSSARSASRSRIQARGRR